MGGINKNNPFELLIQHSPDVITILDIEGTIKFSNLTLETVFGYYQDEIRETNCFDLIEIEDHEILKGLLKRVTKKSEHTLSAELRVIAANGKSLFCEVYATNLIENECINGIVLNFRDISIRKKYENEIAHRASNDYLTGLPNRYELENYMLSKMKSSSLCVEKFAVLFLNLDRFKLVNDSLGHSTGDLLLKQVSFRLKRAIRETDVLFRQSGDEFIILLDDVNRELVTSVAKDVQATFMNPFNINKYEFHCSASIGISMYPDDGDSVEDLLKYADFAMCHAKKQSKHSFEFFTPRLLDEKINHLRIENELHKSIDRGELALYYQPKLNLKTGIIIGVEALLRWNHPNWGLITPETFIPIAEDSGLIISIGEWVINEACLQNAAWHKQGLATVVSVNLSTKQFFQTNLVQTITSALNKSGLEPQFLEIEITESMTVEITRAQAILQQLKQLGIRISIDDFGTGFSSLNYLKNFPVDTLKIDQSFVRELCNNPYDETIVKTIISMAHNLNLSVVAEGVETEEQLVFLQQHLCDEGQGYFFSKPLPPKEIMKNVSAMQRIITQYGISQELNERMWAEKLVASARKELQETVRLQQGMTLKYKKINGVFVHTFCDGELLYRFGLIPNQVIGKELRDFLTQESARRKTLYYERAWEGEENVTYEAQINGIHYLTKLRPIRRGGRVEEVIGSCIDITERKKMEEALGESERKYRLIAENSSDLISIFDGIGRLIYASPSHKVILGYDDVNLYEGEKFIDKVHPEDVQILAENLNFITSNKTSIQLEFRYKHNNNRWVLLETLATPIIGEDGRVEQIVTVGRDITEKRKAEELLWNAEKLSVVGELAAGIAHEIRNPITSIKGFIQLFQSGILKQEYFDIIFAEFHRIEEILSEFLSLSRPQAIKLKKIDLRKLVNDVVTLLGSEAVLKDVKIDLNMEENVQQMKCDPNQLKQVMINLIKNSIESLTQGGEIKIDVRKNQTNHIIIISDNGKGISRERLEKLGEPFFSNKEKGTGLGLMVCFRIIKQHKGTINIESEVNVGTSVELQIPEL